MNNRHSNARYNNIISRLKTMENKDNIKGMERFGINPYKTLGISVVALRKIAKETGKDHLLALELWDSGIHEARILASMVDNPSEVTPAQMDRWVNSVDSWDVCDHCCGNLFDKTALAYEKAAEWSASDKEFTKRAGYVLMAELAVHDKQTGDEEFVRFLQLIENGATDERNFVKKAVNWALRQIGKRNSELNKVALVTAERIKRIESKTARWIANDALREMKGRFD